MANKFKAIYDAEEDILFIYNPEKKSSGSIEVGSHVHISFSAKNDVIGLEVLEATKTLGLLAKTKVTKKMLKSLKNGSLNTKTEKGLLIVAYHLLGKEKSLSGQLIVHDTKYKSPITAKAST